MRHPDDLSTEESVPEVQKLLKIVDGERWIARPFGVRNRK
jgi:hypothetical protein